MSDPVSDRPFLPERRFFIPEVTIINKQRFLAELAKLLTFMYEEDRQHALAAYSEMFEAAGDEQALLQALVSPLRQAVEVARAYNAGKPALTESKKKKAGTEEDENNRFAYLDTIYRIRAEALSGQPEKIAEPVDEDQFSLFDESASNSERKAQAPSPAAAAAIENAVAETLTADWGIEPVEAAAEGERAESAEETPLAVQPEADRAEDAVVEETAAVERADREEPAKADEGEAPNEPEETAVSDEPKADAPCKDAGANEKSTETLAAVAEEISVASEQMPARIPVLKNVRKPRIWAMILYPLLAIPLTLIGIVLLLVPALACLAVAIGCGTLAILTIVAALGSFPKLANLLVALGAALILLAFALLMLMLFIWLLGGAIGGLIHGVIALGGKCCYKEVSVE
ncbi:MAG: hypothetical protein IKI69_08980 [Oscillospiraceae bacterium]|nr:hypothetical protein [Oscillospiraceae bacterium]